ncbi:hypothetical protein DM860_011337 [Cuscuta australis]|uniref:Uncharacterized protein n=1 Tax=Cuscuta australis TaxID=267555 RepID=A0A328DT83_9ASTE|nr:hypothetical protein DM860_011337 [Cuscuta australis]
MRHLLGTVARKALSSSQFPRSKVHPSPSSSQCYSRHASDQLHSHASSSFGIAFDIDGVLLRGGVPIGGSRHALRRLYDDSGGLPFLLLIFDFCAMKVPYVFLTNGGGVPELKRAKELTRLLGNNVLASQVWLFGEIPSSGIQFSIVLFVILNFNAVQVIQGHTPFKQLVKRFENEFIVAVGKGEPAEVMSDYGFKNVLSIDEYASLFENIDPLVQYKKWADKQSHDTVTSRQDPCSERVRAVFVVLCDILRTRGQPRREIAHQPPIFFASDDLAYQALFPSERLGMGAFRAALESVFNSIHPKPLEYTSYGKPNSSVFEHAEATLMQLKSPHHQEISHEMHPFKTLYMVGDNPSVDIKGARQVGNPWFSILTRTGVFKGIANDTDFPFIFSNL